MPAIAAGADEIDWDATDVLKQWTWKALRVAKEEVATAYESVLQDLEGLSTCGGERDSPPEHEQLASDSDASNCEEESMRVSDLIVPAPLRSDSAPRPPCEEQLRPPPPLDDGFELINFEDEARVIVLR